MRWLVVLDPLEGLVSKTDTSLAIMAEARSSGIEVETATIDKLYFETCAAVLATNAGGAQKERALADYVLILMRKEPPYDLAFHYATQLLSLSGTRVVNSPSALRDFNEKLIALPFIQHMPATLVSSDMSVIADFISRQGEVVIKVLDSFQGKAVQKLSSMDPEVVNSLTEGGSQPVMVQKFLQSVYQGDKRVILLGDRFLGAAMRRPKQGYHANFANSDALQTELSKAEQSVVDELGPWLVQQDIHFSGLDFIGEKLTEINITCPTGIQQISEIEGRSLSREVVEYFVQLLKKEQ